MPNTICIDYSFFTLTGDAFYPGKQVAFQLEFDSATDENAVLTYQWYLNGVLVIGKEQRSFTDILSCGAYTIGARVLSSSGWSGIKTLEFQTCKVPLNYTIIGPAALREGAVAEYRILLNYSDGSVSDVTSGYTFTTNYGIFAGNVFTVSSNNVTHDSREAVITAVKVGGSTLTKTIEIVDTTPLILTSLLISGPDTVKEGESASYEVIATYSDGTSQDFSSDYTFYCKDGSFLGGGFIAYKDTIDNNNRSSSIIALKHGIPQLVKPIQIIDVKQEPGILQVDVFGTGAIDIIGTISSTDVGGGQLYAYTGKNIVLPETLPSNAFILASDLINQPGNSLNWRFQFNIEKLLVAYPALTQFNFAIKGRGNASGVVSGAYSLKTSDAVMAIQGESGTYIPYADGGSTRGFSNYNSVIAPGANGSHRPADLPLIIQLVYDVPTQTVTAFFPEVQEIRGDDNINEGQSKSYQVISRNLSGIETDVTSTYLLTCSEGSFNGSTLTIPPNSATGDTRPALIKALKNGYPTVSKGITITDTTIPFTIDTDWQFTEVGALANNPGGGARNYDASHIPAGALWSVNGGDNFGLKITYEASSDCGGTNGLTQSGTAVAKISTSQPARIRVTWTGMGEREDDTFERAELKVNGVLLGRAHSPGGKLKCLIGPVVTETEHADGLPIPAGLNELSIECTTGDGQYNTGTYYQFNVFLVPDDAVAWP